MKNIYDQKDKSLRASEDCSGEESLAKVKTFIKLKELIWNCTVNKSKTIVDLNMLRGMLHELKVKA